MSVKFVGTKYITNPKSYQGYQVSFETLNEDLCLGRNSSSGHQDGQEYPCELMFTYVFNSYQSQFR
jgi:hypothetical protein